MASFPLLSSENMNSFPVNYVKEISCSKNNLQETVERVAEFVSDVYGIFPRLGEDGREKLRANGVAFSSIPHARPNDQESKQFIENLRQKIISSLTSECSDYQIKLSTDYRPQDALEEVAISAFQDRRELGYFFPYKTTTHIFLDAKKTKLTLFMRFLNAY